LDGLVNDLKNTLDPVLTQADLTPEVAGEGWHYAGSEANSVLIYLVAATRTTGDSSIYRAPERTVVVGVDAACESGTGHRPVSVVPLPSVPGGRLATCRGGEQFPPTVAAFRRANVTAYVLTREVTTATAVAAADDQYRALPPGGFVPASSNTGTIVGVVVGVVAVVLGGGLAMLLVARHRRRTKVASAPWSFPSGLAPAPPAGLPPASLPPAGWYPDPADATALRYWTGSGWAAATAVPTPAPTQGSGEGTTDQRPAPG